MPNNNSEKVCEAEDEDIGGLRWSELCHFVKPQSRRGSVPLGTAGTTNQRQAPAWCMKMGQSKACGHPTDWGAVFSSASSSRLFSLNEMSLTFKSSSWAR